MLNDSIININAIDKSLLGNKNKMLELVSFASGVAVSITFMDVVLCSYFVYAKKCIYTSF